MLLSQIILETSSYCVIVLHDLETISTWLKIAENASLEYIYWIICAVVIPPLIGDLFFLYIYKAPTIGLITIPYHMEIMEV